MTKSRNEVRKQGRLTLQEQEFIKKNLGDMTIEEISEKLNRDPSSIEKHAKNKLDYKTTKIDKIKKDSQSSIKQRGFWKDLEKQLSTEEQVLFIEYWSDMVKQFRDDVLPTEEFQMIDLIRMEIVISRLLKEEKVILKDVAFLDELLDFEIKRDIDDDEDKRKRSEEINRLRGEIASLRGRRDSLIKEYKELADKKQKLYKDMKGTRDQRIKDIENRKETFTTWIIKQKRDPVFNKEMNQYMEQMRIALENEEKRLGDYHNYMDNTVDRPLLNSETVMRDEGQ